MAKKKVILAYSGGLDTSVLIKWLMERDYEVICYTSDIGQGEFSENAKKDIVKLDKTTQQRIAKKLQYYLQQDDSLIYARKLVHSKIGSYRFRVGHFRIVFDINGVNLNVLSIQHRKDVYR